MKPIKKKGNVFITAIKNTKWYIYALFGFSIIDIVLFPIFSIIPGWFYFLLPVGDLLNKISYAMLTGTIFYFITQRLKFAEDKIKYSELVNDSIFNLKNTFPNFISKLVIFAPTAKIVNGNIKNMALTRIEYDSIITGLVFTTTLPNVTGMDQYLDIVVGEFQNSYNYYLNKLLEYKEYIENDKIQIIKRLGEKQYVDVAKYMPTMGNIKIIYLKSEAEKLLSIQAILRDL